MKTFLLVRHSKSDWPEDMDDFDRPLTELGRTNAPKMAEFLRFNNIDIDSLLQVPLLEPNRLASYFLRFTEKITAPKKSCTDRLRKIFSQLYLIRMTASTV
jgi:phosphohistidine phosphatase